METTCWRSNIFQTPWETNFSTETIWEGRKHESERTLLVFRDKWNFFYSLKIVGTANNFAHREYAECKTIISTRRLIYPKYFRIDSFEKFFSSSFWIFRGNYDGYFILLLSRHIIYRPRRHYGFGTNKLKRYFGNKVRIRLSVFNFFCHIPSLFPISGICFTVRWYVKNKIYQWFIISFSEFFLGLELKNACFRKE